MTLFYISREKHEAEVSRQAMEACEHIIAEMGAELHDDLIQRLSLLRLSLDKLERSLASPSETEIQIIAMRSEFQEVIQSIRKISRKLISVQSSDTSFDHNIAMLCQNMERPDTGTVHFTSNGTEQDLPATSHTYLSRIVQELIHNSHKHSSAWHVWVRLFWEPDSISIEVEDDGTGSSKIPEFISLLKRKYGTLKMRSKAIGATISYEKGKNGLLARVHCNLKHSDPGSNP